MIPCRWGALTKAVILFIAQGAYAGRAPLAPGTAGTMVGVLLYCALKGLPPAAYLAVAGIVIVLGTWAAGRAEEILRMKDHPTIVIDEIAGYLISMSLLPPVWGFAVAGFFLFRFFDIIKPWPLRGLQTLRGGPGIMVDDVGAGIYTNIVLQTAMYLLRRG